MKCTSSKVHVILTNIMLSSAIHFRYKASNTDNTLWNAEIQRR